MNLTTPPESSFEIKNVWRYTCIAPSLPCAFMGSTETDLLFAVLPETQNKG
jgi:hypothetical protein